MDTPHHVQDLRAGAGQHRAGECRAGDCSGGHMTTAAPVSKRIRFGLFFFACDERQDEQDKYRLVIEGSRFADQHDFSAVWVPERHFARFGRMFSSPPVLLAAIARETRRVALRAGSVSMPINDPIRVAEQWSIVDNLSGG